MSLLLNKYIYFFNFFWQMKWHISVLSLISCCVILVCAESNQCPDSKAVCPEATTCCQLNNNTFGCCPVENAVCCKDSIHCCPVGYSCDIEKGVCKLEGKSVPLLEKVPSMPVSVSFSGVPLLVYSSSVILTNPKLYVHVAKLDLGLLTNCELRLTGWLNTFAGPLGNNSFSIYVRPFAFFMFLILVRCSVNYPAPPSLW